LNVLPQGILNDWPLWGLSSEPASVEVIEGGLTNQNFLVQTSAGKFVLRLHNDSASLGIDRVAEMSIQQLAAAAGLTPAVHYSAPDHSYSVRPYLDGETLSATSMSQCDLSAMADILNRLHNIPVPEGLPTLDTHSACRLYLAEAAAYPHKQSDIQPLTAQVDALEALPAARHICHLDPLAANWLRDTQGRLWLLDWEYATIAHPLLDYAAIDLLLPTNLKSDWQSFWQDKDPDKELMSLATAHIRLLDQCWRLAHQQ